MNLRYPKYPLVVGMISFLLLGACSAISQSFSGINEVVPLENGVYEITINTEDSMVKSSRKEIYEKWDELAASTCGGKGYKVMDKKWLSAFCLSGKIRCEASQK